MLRLKGQAATEEADEQRLFSSRIHCWCTGFQIAADAHLRWTTIEASEENFSALENAVKTVETGAGARWDERVERGYIPALEAAKAQLMMFKGSLAEKSLVEKLQGASEEVLVQHAREHRVAQEKAEKLVRVQAKLDAILREKQMEDDQKRIDEERELSNASSIKNEITRALEKQMVYTNANLKYSSKNISYRRGGVSVAVFAKAFGVPEGTKKATIPSYEVGRKSLRYGACLACSDVSVKLIGEELSATARYSLEK